MCLFIIIAAIILFINIVDDDGLLCDLLAARYGDCPVWETVKSIHNWIWLNIAMNLVNLVISFVISMFVFFGCVCVCPAENSSWEFNINAMSDNLVTEGQWYGRRGHVDGELSYFYSRPLSLGEKIEHIPADKTYVRYSNTERPHVEVYQSRVDIPEWVTKTFFVNWLNDTRVTHYILVVPEGTITNTGQYEIDMK